MRPFFAIRIGHHQQIFRRLADARPIGHADVGDAGIEGAALAQQLFIDQVADPVGRATHVVRRRRHLERRQLLAARYIHQHDADHVTAAALGNHLANGGVIHPGGAPRGHVHLLQAAGLLGHFCRRQGVKTSTARQVGIDDGAHRRAGSLFGAGEGHDGHRQRTAHAFGDFDPEWLSES